MAVIDVEPAKAVEAAPAAQPKLDVDFLKVDHVHACASVRKVSGGIEISALCLPATRKIMAAVQAVADDGANLLFYKPVPRPDGAPLAGYTTLVPRALLDRRLTFEVLNQNGDRYPIFVAGRRKLKLPPSWQFEPYQLTLAYDPSTDGRSPPPQALASYIRSIAVADGRLAIDISLFVKEDDAPEPDAAQFALMNEGHVVFETGFDLLPAKKVFRIAAAVHRQFSAVRPFHGELRLPIASTFAHRGSYSMTIRVGDAVSTIRPYNRYYFQKPSVLTADGEAGPHVIRHFADPETGDIGLFVD
jgi:hypothetical protein